MIVRIISNKIVKSCWKKVYYWLVTKNVIFKVNLGSFGHDSKWLFASTQRQIYIFISCVIFPFSKRSIFKIWKETVKLTDSYVKSSFSANLSEKSHFHLDFN